MKNSFFFFKHHEINWVGSGTDREHRIHTLWMGLTFVNEASAVDVALIRFKIFTLQSSGPVIFSTRIIKYG
jgi:hypothetical protein